MPHEVIMPALGVAQDTGLIIAWLKQSGEAVKTGDALMEIETDKAVMEVEAQADGYLTNVTAVAGDHVPVGQVVGLIAESAEPTEPVDARPEKQPVTETDTAPLSDIDKTHVQYPDATEATEPRYSPGNRILASPKARRLAIEQGLDLDELVRHGVPQPFHVSDLEALTSLRKPLTTQDAATRDSRQARSASSALRVEALVPAQADIDFIGWVETRKNISVAARMNWLRYASAALRQASGRHSEVLIVEVRQLCDIDGCFADADLSRLSMPVTKSADQTPDLVLRDLSKTPITAVTTSAQSAPVLTVRQAQENYTISLDYLTDQLDENVAIGFLTEFSRRLAEPLRHLL